MWRVFGIVVSVSSISTTVRMASSFSRRIRVENGALVAVASVDGFRWGAGMDVVRHRARRRIGIGLAGAGVLVTTLAVVSNASQAGATGLESRHFDKAPASASLVRPASLSSKPITVVVQMAGDPVTVTDANSATKLTKAERQARKDGLRQAQLPAESKIRGFG